MGIDLIISVFAIVLGIVNLILTIIMFVHIKNTDNKIKDSFNEIKSKIGSIIRDINLINKIEYDVDMEQQLNINNLSKKLLSVS
jgi:hypothetical protein